MFEAFPKCHGFRCISANEIDQDWQQLKLFVLQSPIQISLVSTFSESTCWYDVKDARSVGLLIANHVGPPAQERSEVHVRVRGVVYHAATRTGCEA